MKFKEYLQLASKIEEYEKQIELTYNKINEVTDLNDLCVIINKTIIDYLKNDLSQLNEIELTNYIINNEAYFGFSFYYNPYNMLRNIIKSILSEDSIFNYTSFIDKTTSILVERYSEFFIGNDIFVSYGRGLFYFKDIKKFIDLFEIDISKISLNSLLLAYEESKKFNALFDEAKIAELNELMIFK